MSGSHRSGSHRSGSGGYRSYGGDRGYGRDPEESPSAGGSGPYRGGSGSHRIVHSRPQSRRVAVVLVGAVGGVAACILAVFVVLGAIRAGDDSGDATNSGAATGGGSTDVPGERSVVPDACNMVGDGVANALAPNADRTQSSTYQSSDRQNQCVWGAYTGSNKRVLTVELRAIAGAQGRSSTDVAGRTFQSEREGDEAGKSLLPTQRLAAKRSVAELGEEAYVVYAVDAAQDTGEAVVNTRVGNVLITVHYSGGTTGKAPLPQAPAMNGAISAAKETVKTLSTAR